MWIGLYVNMNRLMCVFGTRPEAIKMCPLINTLKKKDSFEVIVCSTGQHKEMLKQVLEIFEVKPDYELNIMHDNSSLISITTRMLEKIAVVYMDIKPDLVLVHGDTTTSLVATLAAFYCRIPVAHVEAGLRTYNKYSPYPEELNRVLISRIAELHFAPTENNKSNLIKEGIDKGIYITGNTVIDAMSRTIHQNYVFHEEILNSIDYNKKKCIMLTVHRRENWGQPIKEIFSAINELINNNEDIEIIYPIHLNPIIQNYAYKYLADNSRIHLVSPLDILDTHNLMKKSYLVMTDSGGIQEEAPSCNAPVIVLRRETERMEVIEAGGALLAGTEKSKIIEIVTELLHDEKKYNNMAKCKNPYGDGNASTRITEIISKWCEKK